MYEGYFGINKAPFSMTPDPGFLFLAAKHREALAGLLFAVTSRKGFLVLTGEAGTGKTTLLSRILRSMPEERAQFSFVINPTLTASEFLEMAMIDFGLTGIPSSKAQRLLQLQTFLLDAHRAGRTCVLIVDEAHKLTPDLLEEIRLLTNFETADYKLLQIILAGQPELTDLLNREDMRQLKQRIAVRLKIDPLQPIEVGQYIQARWMRAGASDMLPFTSSAVALIAQATKGIPRVINAICDNALTNAFAIESRMIDTPQIMEVLSDLQISFAPGPNGAPKNGAYRNGGSSSSQLVPVAVAGQPDSAKTTHQIIPTTFHSLERYIPRPPKPVRRWGLGLLRG